MYVNVDSVGDALGAPVGVLEGLPDVGVAVLGLYDGVPVDGLGVKIGRYEGKYFAPLIWPSSTNILLRNL